MSGQVEVRHAASCDLEWWGKRKYDGALWRHLEIDDIIEYMDWMGKKHTLTPDPVAQLMCTGATPGTILDSLVRCIDFFDHQIQREIDTALKFRERFPEQFEEQEQQEVWEYEMIYLLGSRSVLDGMMTDWNIYRLNDLSKAGTTYAPRMRLKDWTSSNKQLSELTLQRQGIPQTNIYMYKRY